MLKAVVVSLCVLINYPVFASGFDRKPYDLEYLRLSCPSGLGFASHLVNSEIYFSRVDRNFVLKTNIHRDGMHAPTSYRIFGTVARVHSTSLLTEILLNREARTDSQFVIRIVDKGQKPIIGQTLRVVHGAYEVTELEDRNFNINADFSCLVESI